MRSASPGRSQESRRVVKCTVVTSTLPDLDRAVGEALPQISAGLGGERPDLLLAFFTDLHAPRAESLHRALVDGLDPGVLLGCPASGVIGSHSEMEGGGGLVLWGARWPGADLQPFSVVPVDGEQEPTLTGWPERAGVAADAGFLVLADPYTSPADVLLGGFVQAFPGQVLVGGMASAGAGPGQGQMLTRAGVQAEGVVGVTVGGTVAIDTVVSQGCRPIGKHFVITRAERNYIHSLGGRPALSQLRQVFGDVDDADRLLMQSALHVGLVVDGRKSHFETRDLLVRHVIGFRPEAQSIAISDHVRAGQTIQFMVRDAKAASDDLALMLTPERDRPAPLGALLFSCNGRGQRFFGVPNHDIDGLHTHLGPVPTAGFFAAGEIGPVGGRPFLHGLTASIALFRERHAAR